MAYGNNSPVYNWGNPGLKTFEDSLGPWYDNQVRRNAGATNDPGDNQEYDQPNPVSIGQAINMADSIYSSDPLNEQEQNRLNELKGRYSRLKPISKNQVYGSARIAGNPYSIDTRGLATGAVNLGKSAINSVRRKRRGEFTGELSNLAQRQKQAQQTAENKQKFLGDFLPKSAMEQYKQGQQNQRLNRQLKTDVAVNNADNTSLEKRNKADNAASAARQQAIEDRQKELENLRFKHDKVIEGIQKQLDRKDFHNSSGVFNQLVGMADDEVNVINDRLKNINYSIDNGGGFQDVEALKSKRNKLRERKKELQRAHINLNRRGDPYSRERLNKFSNILTGKENKEQTGKGGKEQPPPGYNSWMEYYNGDTGINNTIPDKEENPDNWFK